MKNLTLILSTIVDWVVVFCAFLDNIFTMFSPEILASFPAQYIYVISADILALFHPCREHSFAGDFPPESSHTAIKDADNVRMKWFSQFPMILHFFLELMKAPAAKEYKRITGTPKLPSRVTFIQGIVCQQSASS